MPGNVDGSKTLILDNGAFELKALWAGLDDNDISGGLPSPAASRTQIYVNGLAKHKNATGFFLKERTLPTYKHGSKYIGSLDGAHYNPLEVNDVVDCSNTTQVNLLTDPTYMTWSEFDKGHLVSWEVQQSIWCYLFTEKHMNCDPWTTNLVVTEPVLNPPTVQEFYDEVIFESFQFQSCLRVPAPVLANHGIGLVEREIDDVLRLFGSKTGTTNEPLPITNDGDPQFSVVIDIGHSFTYILPFICSTPIYAAAIRVDVGGKYLTNYLKEMISFRHWNMMEEPVLVQQIKESTCFIARDFNAELSRAQNDRLPKATFVLPNSARDGSGYLVKGGLFGESGPKDEQQYVKQVYKAEDPDDSDQVLELNNERIVVPELLLTPSYSGLNQAGIAESIVRSIEKLPKEYHAMLYRNILLIGGSSKIFGLKRRIEKEIRPWIDPIYDVRVIGGVYPDLTAVLSANHALAQEGNAIHKQFVTREEYYEHGSKICAKRFTS